MKKMIPALGGIALVLILSGFFGIRFAFKSSRNPVSVASVVPASPLPTITIGDVTGPANPTVKIQPGANLREIATAAYGHEAFAGFVAKWNGITDPGRIVAGSILKSPPLPVALRDAGMDPAYQPAINVLAKTWNDLGPLLDGYERERDAAGSGDGSTFSISPGLAIRLTGCADAMDAALQVLANPEDGHGIPRSTIGQFAGASGALRQFAMGRVESRDYDTFLAEQGFGLGFTYALVWVQMGHR